MCNFSIHILLISYECILSGCYIIYIYIFIYKNTKISTERDFPINIYMHTICIFTVMMVWIEKVLFSILKPSQFDFFFVEQSQTIHNSFDAIWLYHILNTHQKFEHAFCHEKMLLKCKIEWNERQNASHLIMVERVGWFDDEQNITKQTVNFVALLRSMYSWFAY